MTAHETALRFALLKVLTGQLGTSKKVADSEIRTTWRVKDRNAALLPDGTEIGAVTLASGKKSAKVNDDDAYLAWVLETHPEEVEQITTTVTRVKPDYTERTLSYARQTGHALDPATGEIVPGVKVEEGDPYTMTRLAPDADQLVAKAWRDGSLMELVATLVQPAIEGGES